ncbi:unnamed protein product [Diplocarpon coronariae]
MHEQSNRELLCHSRKSQSLMDNFHPGDDPKHEGITSISISISINNNISINISNSATAIVTRGPEVWMENRELPRLHCKAPGRTPKILVGPMILDLNLGRPLIGIGIIELLEQDSRPTFIVDINAPELEVNGRMTFVPVYCNKSLRFFDSIRNVVYAETFYPNISQPTPLQASVAAEQDFKEWVMAMPSFDSSTDGYLPHYHFLGMYWSSSTLRQNWRVVSASQVPSQRQKSQGTPRTAESRSNLRSSASSSTARPTLFAEGPDPDGTFMDEESDLSKQLADSESKFKVLTELSPVGMYYLSPDGNILYCNETWYKITGHPRGLEGEMSFMNVIAEIDHPVILKEWNLLTTRKGMRAFELRLRNPWINESGEPRQKWILASCGQEFHADGKTIKTIMGCITDISAQKNAQVELEARANLTQKLADRTQEAAHHAEKFQLMAELAPCGMFTFDPEGKITWANSQCYEMTGHSRATDAHYPMSILECIEYQDRTAFKDEWQQLTVTKEEVTMELRFKRPWVQQESSESVESVRSTRWILFLARPQLDDDGTLTSVLGCTTDISGFKSAEHMQKISRVEAEEAKRRQETFIDMTSHEMRNPLSAIMLSADGISESINKHRSEKDKSDAKLQELLVNNLDAAQTIVLCAQHQKRIIDDVLTLSKLNSAMLQVTPVSIQVERNVRETLKMYERELLADSIRMQFTVEPSYHTENVDFVLCDPVRAIKFTRSESSRSIFVSLGASVNKPPKSLVPNIKWFPSKDFSSVQDLTLRPEWGTGQQIYLYFTVKDTGRGLSEQEKNQLFRRFSQASPKTHVQYGGSGLGLFISRKLTELQGDEIGVESTEGAGSTFAFYIKARRELEASSVSSSGSTPKRNSTDAMSSRFPKTRPDYHILLVEDNLINQKVLSKQLRSAGCVVHVANHGAEALDFLSKTALWTDCSNSGTSMKLSLVLMDLEMPIMDGLQCTRRIRDLEREGKINRPVPIIAVTANTRFEQLDTARAAGVDDIVAKPFQIPELMQKSKYLLTLFSLSNCAGRVKRYRPNGTHNWVMAYEHKTNFQSSRSGSVAVKLSSIAIRSGSGVPVNAVYWPRAELVRHEHESMQCSGSGQGFCGARDYNTRATIGAPGSVFREDSASCSSQTNLQSSILSLVALGLEQQTADSNPLRLRTNVYNVLAISPVTMSSRHPAACPMTPRAIPRSESLFSPRRRFSIAPRIRSQAPGSTGHQGISVRKQKKKKKKKKEEEKRLQRPSRWLRMDFASPLTVGSSLRPARSVQKMQPMSGVLAIPAATLLYSNSRKILHFSLSLLHGPRGCRFTIILSLLHRLRPALDALLPCDLVRSQQCPPQPADWQGAHSEEAAAVEAGHFGSHCNTMSSSRLPVSNSRGVSVKPADEGPSSASQDFMLGKVASDFASASASAKDLGSVGLLELLDVDDRPALIFDLTSSKVDPTYHNGSLQKVPLLELKIGNGALATGAASKDPDCSAFLDWAVSSQHGGFPHTTYCGLWWTAKTIRNRWRIVTGAEGDNSNYISARRRQAEVPKFGRAQTESVVRPSQVNFQSDEALEAQIAAFRLREGASMQSFPSPEISQKPKAIQPSETLHKLDFISAFPAVIPSPHRLFFLEFDWASTDLGPVSTWSTALRGMVNILMSDPRPAAMYWGRERTMMYNESYVNVTGQKHPGMMGKAFAEAWSEIAGDFTVAFEKAYQTGEAFVIDDAQFYIERHGYLEETYYSISIIPFLVEDDNEIAFYNPVFDTTRQVIADRRMALLLRMGQYVSSSRDPKDFWHQATYSLQADSTAFPDIPFAVLYSVDGDFSDTVSEASDYSHANRNWTLEGKIRVPSTNAKIPTRATEQELEEFIHGLPEMLRAQTPTVLYAENGTLPDFVRDIRVLNDEPTQSAVLLPIRTTGDTVFGFMILGLNPRKRFDGDYKVFVELLNRQLATSLASAVLFEEEMRRAARDRSLLTKRLALQTHEALEVETRFRRMADLAPVGMFHIDTSGVLIYANENYYELTQYPRGVREPMTWLGTISELDVPVMETEWSNLLLGKTANLELRLRRPFVGEDIDGEKVGGPTYILAAAYPEMAEDGTITGVLGCLTDISRQKWMEGFQTRKMLEAVERKRQQENFIDMTSHEMRNPLSAIVQCADWIGTSLSKFDCNESDVIIPKEVIDGYVDATETIALCAQHQKRIIDDVLTLSKLDSDLLIITPIDVQPFSTIQATLKMFDVEVQNSDIDLRLNVDPSYSKLAVDWVRLDPSRLSQVLINLVTNAIKFTTNQSKRKIVVGIGASLEPPTATEIEYLPRSTDRPDMTMTGGLAWGSGEPIYICVQVEDSGRGLDEFERNLLFKRFSQASPRTHVQYGGSGLGLFICRQLTELQGGQIGVTSSVGIGSKFAFYVRARRCNPPTATQPVDLPRARPNVANYLPSTSLKPGNPPQPSQPRHVLVVEDNIVNQKVLSRQLQSAGCIVSVANHGREALAFLEKSWFWKGLETSGVELSVVLMDLEMPVMDGLTCVKLIRQLQQDGMIVEHIPVIAVTANARSEQISTAKESGMDSVVTKPFRIPDLLPEMEKLILRRNAGALERSASAPV